MYTVGRTKKWAPAVHNLTVKNVIFAAVIMYVTSVIVKVPQTFTNVTAATSTINSVSAPGIKAAPAAKPEARQTPVVKILDLPDTETLRLNDTTFVDLGWRRTADQGGEWVGHIGSDTEYLPLNSDQIAGMLKEAQLKALPLPPISRAEDLPKKERRKPVVASEPVSNGIGLTGVLALLMTFAAMMYIRYRIAKMTFGAAQSAAGMAKRALSDLLTPKKNETKTQPSSTQVIAARAPAPIAVSTPYKKPASRGTVVRPGSGLFGFLKGAR